VHQLVNKKNFDSVCVFVTLVIQRAKPLPCIIPVVICGLSSSTLFLRIISEKV
jgi:hypothetical protein